MAQFVLFAFFILSEFEGSVKRDLYKNGGLMDLFTDKAKGHAIATGVLFVLTLITKIM